MKNLGTGLLLALAAVLLILAARTLRQLERVGDRLDVLETRSKSPPPGLAAPPPAAVPETRVPAPSTRAEAAPAPEVEAKPVVASGFTLTESTVRSSKKARPMTADQLGFELGPEQKRAIEAVLEARRREQLQIDGDAAFRHRELERRYDAQIRAWLDPEQRRRFDESRAVPRPDGPLTGSAPDYIKKDPAPYDLEVEWGGEWWPARTKDVRGELTLIHYVGHGEEWHEWVGPERVRPRR